MDQHGKAGLENQFGRGVYTADGLVSSGVFANREQYDFSNSSSPRDKSATSIEEAIEVQLTRSPQKGSLHSGQGSMSPNRPGAFHITKDKSLISHQLSVLLDSLPNSIAKNVSGSRVMYACRYNSLYFVRTLMILIFNMFLDYARPAFSPSYTCPRVVCTPPLIRIHGG
jgi:hypothetical protein